MNKIKLTSLQEFIQEQKRKKEEKRLKIKENSLIEYQKKFNAGKIKSQNNKNNKHIFLKLEGNVSNFRKNWLINIDDISEILQHSEIAKIGYTNNYIVGVSNFKGSVCTVIDMSMFLNNRKTMNNSNSCVLLRKNDSIALLWPKIEISGILLTKTSIDEFKNERFFEKVPYVKEYYKDENGNIWNEIDIIQFLHSKQIIDGSNINEFA